MARRKPTDTGLLETSHQFAAASQSGRRMPKRGRKTVRLNGPIIQSIVAMMKKAAAATASGTSAESQIDMEPSKSVADAKPAYASRITRRSIPPSTWSSNITGSPAAIAIREMTRHDASFPRMISALVRRVARTKSSVRLSRSFAIDRAPHIMMAPAMPA